MEAFAKLERCQLTDARPLDDRLREMTSFGERQLSLERSQLLEIVAFWPDDRFGPEARVDATTGSSAYWPIGA